MFALHLNEPMGVWIDITITKKTNTEKSMDVFQNKYWHKKKLTDFFFYHYWISFCLTCLFNFSSQIIDCKIHKKVMKGFSVQGEVLWII